MDWTPYVATALVGAACVVSAVIGAFVMAWWKQPTAEERRLLELREDA